MCHLEDSLASFHSNKDVFIDLGIRDHFNIPKVHSLIHYSSSITLFSTVMIQRFGPKPQYVSILPFPFCTIPCYQRSYCY
ncbi:hypothetical protein H4582DRAFT_1817754 [Lactarius indigo]|nr:hypothetical protein H4582DRAFT_1817754 [Lactarius indigo]